MGFWPRLTIRKHTKLVNHKVVIYIPILDEFRIAAGCETDVWYLCVPNCSGRGWGKFHT